MAHEDSSNECQKRVCKGVPRVAIKRSLRHDMYCRCLTDHCQFAVSALCLRSDHHTLYTMRVNKQALSPYYDKRYILNNGRDTLAYGHYRIRADDDDDSAPPPAKIPCYTTC